MRKIMLIVEDREYPSPGNADAAVDYLRYPLTETPRLMRRLEVELTEHEWALCKGAILKAFGTPP